MKIDETTNSIRETKELDELDDIMSRASFSIALEIAVSLLSHDDSYTDRIYYNILLPRMNILLILIVFSNNYKTRKLVLFHFPHTIDTLCVVTLRLTVDQSNCSIENIVCVFFYCVRDSFFFAFSRRFLYRPDLFAFFDKDKISS